MGLFRIDGNPYNNTLNPVLISAAPIDYQRLCVDHGPWPETTSSRALPWLCQTARC